MLAASSEAALYGLFDHLNTYQQSTCPSSAAEEIKQADALLPGLLLPA
jgi:hypothetical protein